MKKDKNKIINNFLDKELSIEKADGYPAFFEMTSIGFTNKLYDTNLASYKFGGSYFSQGEVNYIAILENQQWIGKNIIQKYLQDKKAVNLLYEKWRKNYGNMLEKYYGLFQENFSEISDKDLIEKSDELFNFYAKEISMPGFIDGFMFYADKRFVFLVEEFCKKNNIPDPITIASTLTASTEPSFFNEEQKDLLKIIKIAKNTKDKKTNNLIEKHLLKYSWIKSGYYGYKEYTREELLKELNDLMKGSVKIDNNFFIKNKKEKKELIKKYNFIEEILAISELSELFIKWQDYRKIYTLTFVALKEKILREVSRRKNIDFELLKYSLSNEIGKILMDKFVLSELSKRQRGCFLIHSNGKLREIYSGKEAVDFRKKITKKTKKDVLEIKGMVASMGKITGIVKIVLSIKNLDKVKDGDILVSPMTRPEHISAMKKAGAIVTDDGGITCHAAIVSRELGKPCIVGTKIATQVLKDGDLVEVDANNGVVRIIKRKK